MITRFRRWLALELLALARVVRVDHQRLGGGSRLPTNLFAIAASAHELQSKDQLINGFLDEVLKRLNCESACLHEVDNNEVIVLRYARGSGPGAVEERIRIDDGSISDHPILQSYRSGIVVRTKRGPYFHVVEPRGSFGGRPVMVTAPVQNINECMAVLTLFFTLENEVTVHDGFLLDLGRFLGLALDKIRLSTETRRLALIAQRSQIAAELHDSLAQTVASMNLQITMLKNAMGTVDTTVHRHLASLSHTVDEANTEVRELIEHFRVPLAGKGLVQTIQRAADRLKQQHRIHVLIQVEGDLPELPDHVTMELARISQEALTNIGKHAKATSVRIRLERRKHQLSLLIEDDGVGFALTESAEDAGYHVGLNVMHERADRINAELTIESEPDEGSRILCTLPLAELTT
ncbi:MAG: sensor histidine kinase [Gammaproteobacteria bacterium]|nr:sensor histidine kinase [Gammaproteobacteria bacterium]